MCLEFPDQARSCQLRRDQSTCRERIDFPSWKKMENACLSADIPNIFSLSTNFFSIGQQSYEVVCWFSHSPLGECEPCLFCSIARREALCCGVLCVREYNGIWWWSSTVVVDAYSSNKKLSEASKLLDLKTHKCHWLIALDSLRALLFIFNFQL